MDRERVPGLRPLPSHASGSVDGERRGVTEVDVRAMLERATALEPNIVEGRFLIHARYAQRPWIVIVAPHGAATLLVVVTDYEVPE